MTFKVILSFALALAVCSVAQAQLERYLEFKEGKEGYQERCYLKYALRNAIIRYPGETLAKELETDLEKLEEILDKEELGDYDDCFVYSGCNNLRQFALPNEKKDDELFISLCGNHFKYGILCNYIGDEILRDGIRSWLCELDKEYSRIVDKIDRKCPEKTLISRQSEADKQLEMIKSYSDEDLTSAKEASANELEAVNRKIESVSEEARKSIRDILAENLAKFKQCWNQVEILDFGRITRKLIEAGEKKAERLEAERRKKSGFLGKLKRKFAIN